MIKAGQLKKNQVVFIQGQLYKLIHISSKTPSARGTSTLFKCRFTHIQTGQKLDQVYKSDDLLEEAQVERRNAQYLYQDGESLHLMCLDDYSQIELPAEQCEDELRWLTDGLEGVQVLFSGGTVLGMVLPHTVDLEITETAPVIKGATATSRSKPARLVTGAEIMVPEYLESGTRIRVNTETGEFVSRL